MWKIYICLKFVAKAEQEKEQKEQEEEEEEEVAAAGARSTVPCVQAH